ncbi:hypothetical protein GCM10012275_23010 [Longimycelium tulufanense]|uniref:ESAT-6-like protein n=1 Tax=Longimycelium tulufanense TaxID=907463 RepID=A0A8J3CDE7_9PSEU|nr:WXG100 family type VII secretion target [Longimycelium tulufanense]GGM51516.1 hypothetical protein GCM10012275_23010 [Longimycelium tulufanense]
MEILVTFGELQAGQQNVTSGAQKIQSTLDDLKQRIQPVVSTWQGEAAEAYNHHQQQWDQAAADLQQVLAQIGVALGHAAENYQQAERANTSRWG